MTVDDVWSVMGSRDDNGRLFCYLCRPETDDYGGIVETARGVICAGSCGRVAGYMGPDVDGGWRQATAIEVMERSMNEE